MAHHFQFTFNVLGYQMKETSATALDQVIIKLDTELSSDIPVIKIAVNILQSSNTIIMIQTIQVTQEVNLHQNSEKMTKETYSKCKYNTNYQTGKKFMRVTNAM